MTAYSYTDRDLIKTNLTTKVLFEHVIAPLPENLTCNLDGSVHRRCNHSDRDIFSKYIYTYISLVDRINLKIVITLKNIYLCTYSDFRDLIYNFFLWFIFLLQSWVDIYFFCIPCILLYIYLKIWGKSIYFETLRNIILFVIQTKCYFILVLIYLFLIEIYLAPLP